MQGIEQLFIMVIYLFWVLVFGFLLIAWRPSVKKKTRPVLPVTGCGEEKTVENREEGNNQPPAAQGEIDEGEK